MKRLTIRLAVIWLAFAPLLLAAQKDYKINFRIKGIRDTICLVANYYGNGTYIKDTLKVDGNGRCTFKAAADLPKGLYILVVTDKVYFDFVVNSDARFTMETDKADPIKKMVITGSPENTIFYDYLRFNTERYTKLAEFEKQYKSDTTDKAAKERYIRETEQMNKDLVAYRLDLVKKHPDSFTALMINVMKEPEVPEVPILPNGRKDSTYAYRYFKSNFWDGTDFTDDRVLRTPVFHNKLVRYFDKILIQNPDTIIRESDYFIEKARPNAEMFKYMVWFTTRQYENSEIMGFDKVFVHVVDKYYVTGEATWVNKTVMESIIKKANRTRPLLLGQVAPNMIMLDTNNKAVSMHAIQAKFLILLFWDPDCGHCEKEIPKMKEFYDQNKEKYGLEIFTVCSDTSLVKWKKALIKRQMNWINVNGPRTYTGNYHDQYDITTSPVIFILNEKKEIIAKRVGVDQFSQFFSNYVKMAARKQE